VIVRIGTVPLVAFLVTGAVLVRVVFCFFLFPTFLAPYATVGTQTLFDDYLIIARQVVSGAGFSLPDGTVAIHRPPLYSLFLTLPAVVTSSDASAVSVIQVMQSFVAGVSVLVAFLAARLISGGSSKIAAGAAAIVGFWPYSIWITKSTVPENLLILLVLIQLYLGLRYFYQQQSIWVGLFGVASGFLYLTHASYLLYVVVSMLGLLVVTKGSSIFTRSLILLLSFLCVVAPWNVRNAQVGFLSLSPATGFGLHYLKGWYYFEQLGTGNSYFSNLEEQSAAYANEVLAQHGVPAITGSRERSDAELMERVDRIAVEHIKGNLTSNLVKVVLKAPCMWIRQQSALRALVNLLLLCPLVFLAWKGGRTLPAALLVLLITPALALTAAMAFVFVEDAPMRYALPLFPILALLAAMGMRSRDNN
jgi:4-amino-4-deoxy-L-arabinose transferase-like glycosyltransferase